MNNSKNIDDFIAGYPKEVQLILQKIRSTIKQAAPEAKEKISYGVPTFTINGKNLIHFSAYKAHIGLYPGPKVIESLKDELKHYKTSKGTIKFPLDQPIPDSLIAKITLLCLTICAVNSN
jgi:uncharacterized protein YdhG (YjbR/CyaY superfamily)